MKTAEVVQGVLEALSRQHPGADTELRHGNAFELLVATILSAQATDVGVNRVTPDLFARYPDAATLASAAQEDVERLVKSTGFFRQKTRAIIGMSQALIERHGGDVPRTMDALVKLPGVGRKTANVVLGHAMGIPGLAVDRHVLRVSNRIGIASSDDPERVEQQLTGALPPGWWTRAADTMTLHGRRICKPTPQCERCAVNALCDFRRSTGRAARAPVVSKHSPAPARSRGRRPAATGRRTPKR
ncbi:MAG: endonuclease III [Acidobacteria bacterium]|nr:endonuclease III [Acidobacteriota bacterium]